MLSTGHISNTLLPATAPSSNGSAASRTLTSSSSTTSTTTTSRRSQSPPPLLCLRESVLLTIRRYEDSLGCDSVPHTNTSNLYARYTTSVLCAGIVQDSKAPCDVPAAAAPPLCAESCAQNARSEEYIALNASLCGRPAHDYMDQIRADFTVCSLPVNSLAGDCVTGDMNEPQNCGFADNLPGLCGYCARSSPNATDSCCTNSRVDVRCKGFDYVEPTVTGPPLILPTASQSGSQSQTATATATPDAAAPGASHGLSRGAVAGAVVGAVAGALALALLAFFLLWLRRRRNTKHSASIFNTPNPSIARRDSGRKPLAAAMGGAGLGLGMGLGLGANKSKTTNSMSETSAAYSTPRQSRMVAMAEQDGARGGPLAPADGYEVLMTPRSGGREMRMSAISSGGATGTGTGTDEERERRSERRSSKRSSYHARAALPVPGIGAEAASRRFSRASTAPAGAREGGGGASVEGAAA
ncbi:hypothetical protein KEM52_002450, partial [Ascosphaera acerosa]